MAALAEIRQEGLGRIAEMKQRALWLKGKAEGGLVAELLDPLPTGAEFRLDSRAGRAYRSLYRKNGEGSWDQVKGTCEAPHVINMSPESLGFAVGSPLIAKALLAEEREDWPVHQPDAPEAPIPGRHWYGGCNPDYPRVNPSTGICEDCGGNGCPVCGRENCPDHR